MTDRALLEVVDLQVDHRGVRALDGVDLAVTQGQVTGLIGPNGAGKTTCIDALAGMVTPTRGHIRFAGRSLTGVAPHLRARRGLVRTFQSLELFEDLTVAQNLAVGARVPTWRDTIADLFRVATRRTDPVDDALELCGLAGIADRYPTELSNGTRHLVTVARAVAMRPRLVLLDEPAAGLGPAETDALATMIERIRHRGITVLVVDHDLSLVFGICDTVAVLDFGRIIATGTPDRVRTDPTVAAAYLGTDGTGR